MLPPAAGVAGEYSEREATCQMTHLATELRPEDLIRDPNLLLHSAKPGSKGQYIHTDIRILR